ncbi:MAG: peptidoglycan DD-metalloendopeptidase family protein [Bacteroidia bacterium]|nr:peptidoglycan DD-metalloendopeptidase family protein [Bacteroidia bacterium]MCZ2248660.1 peptidoglycan DD-metalloendopeptidase family protein [Bacteroidia bacterium]
MNAFGKWLLLFFIFLNTVVCAQSKKELEKRKAKLQSEIKATNKLLDETKKNKRTSLNQLVTLNKKIGMREELISTIGTELNLLGNQIDENQQKISYLEKELEVLKKEYAEMIIFAHRNQSNYNKLMFVFSADDFNQAFKRLKYFQQYGEYRKKQAALIDSTKSKINMQNRLLMGKKEEKNKLLISEEEQKDSLTKEKQEKEKVLSQLQSKEKQLKAELAKRQADANKLNAAIKKIIDEEVKKAREEARRAAAEAKKKKETSKNTSGTTNKPDAKEPEDKSEPELKLTPEAQKLSNNFAANKSKLPWPVTEGIISSGFGEHDHPVLKGIKVKNNGIDISTKNTAPVRAIFEGTVSGVISIPGAGKAVIVRHGEYLTVYSNLDNVTVNKGDKVNTKQQIGRVSESDDDRGELHFEIWKGSVLLNPAQWIIN